ncbi:hypothetical protein [Paenibacillus sp. OAS669]|uniref:hypothetical protein n=1 Tax=Paenibacillus sp. OAS669 TaxID=2663821 RepID=UPI00178A0970|nr:hypothetical protein [Paenibacillus sp. OAS669]MBE1446146.1 hypothetical protein [Paenibacillus sp. OAS669]
MAMYAYKDAARTVKILARNAQKQDKGNRYYCPNHKCDAHMFIRNIEGVSASYFGAIHSHGHINNCPHGASNGFNPNNYDEDTFEFDNALLALTMPSKSQTKKEFSGEHCGGIATTSPPRTIRQIYSMCKAHDCSDSYNGVTIGKMLLDNRSVYMYPKGVFGWRIIEAKCKKPHFYDSAKKELSLIASTAGEEYTFILKFEDEELFKEIKNVIFSNREYFTVVAGRWSSSGTFNVFCTTLSSKKQLAIIK